MFVSRVAVTKIKFPVHIFIKQLPGNLQRRDSSTTSVAAPDTIIGPVPRCASLLASIKRCRMSYISSSAEATAAFESLGCKVIKRMSTNTSQAVLHVSDEGKLTLTITGTRISLDSLRKDLTDLWEDWEPLFFHRHLEDNDVVACGALDRWTEIWAWARPVVGDAPLVVEGHSLGGQTTHLAMRLLGPQVAQAYAWEAPKAMNASAWSRVDVSRCVTVLHGRDPLAAWPPPEFLSDLRHPPGPILWIRDRGSWEWTTAGTWPGGDLRRIVDHFPESIIPSLEVLCNES